MGYFFNDNNQFMNFEDEFIGLEHPNEYYNSSYENELKRSDNNFLDNLDMLNNYSSFSFEFPGLQAPSFNNNLKQSFNFSEFKSNNKNSDTKTQTKLKGSKQFEEAFEKAVSINPEVSKYKNFLTKIAKLESGFNSYIQNRSGAPYYGYFLMGKNEIKNTTGLTVEQFRNDPVQLILGAVKLYKMYLKTVKAIGIYDLCREKGFSDDAIAAGAWAGGPGGVKTFIKGLGDPSDSHWYKKAGIQGGTSVGRRMKEFNNYG